MSLRSDFKLGHVEVYDSWSTFMLKSDFFKNVPQGKVLMNSVIYYPHGLAGTYISLIQGCVIINYINIALLLTVLG